LENKLIYLDNAATSFPKPEVIYKAANKAMKEAGGNPGRSGHSLSIKASEIIEKTRLICANFFEADKKEEIILTSSATMSLNLALKGLLLEGDHVITGFFEHNSILLPLYSLQKNGVEVSKTDLTIKKIKKVIKPNTKLITCTHVSNVTGSINDIKAIGAFCRENEILFLVDAAGSAGSKLINVNEMNIDMLAFPGHKGLLGLQGTGGLYVRDGISLQAITEGGMGAAINEKPYKYEVGTLNTPGFASLAAGVEFIINFGIEEIMKKEAELTNLLINGIKSIKNINLIGNDFSKERSSIVSIEIKNINPSEASLFLDSAFNIAVRGGFHCAPEAHKKLGTYDTGGTLRISPNFLNTKEEIIKCLEALEVCISSF